MMNNDDFDRVESSEYPLLVVPVPILPKPVDNGFLWGVSRFPGGVYLRQEIESTETFTPYPTETPTFSPSPTVTPSHTLSPTGSDGTPQTPAKSPTKTPIQSPTITPTDTYTDTYTPFPTETDTPTFSPTDTVTETNTPSPSETPTPIWTPTFPPTDTPTPTPTYSHTPTFTPIPTDTSTPSPGPTDTPTNTYTQTATHTFTTTFTPTNTIAYTATFTYTSTSTAPPTPTFTDTKTSTPTWTMVPTDTPTPTRINVRTPPIIPSDTSVPTVSPTVFTTDTFTPILTFTPINTPVSSRTQTFAPTLTETNRPAENPLRIQRVPDIKVVRNESASRVLKLNDFVERPEAFGRLEWSVECFHEQLSVSIDAASFLSIEALAQTGIFPLTLHVSSEGQSVSQPLVVRVLPFMFNTGFYLPPQIFTKNEIWVSPFSLWDCISPAHFPRDQIRFEIVNPECDGIRQASIDEAGRLVIYADSSDAPDPSRLGILARHVTPTPTLSPTPITVRTPTPTAKQSIVLPSCGSQVAFRLTETFATGNQPIDFDSGDLNRDGMLDFWIANLDDDHGTLWLSGPQSYVCKQIESAGYANVSSLIHDLDGDGYADLIIVSIFDAALRVAWGDRSCEYESVFDVSPPLWIPYPSAQHAVPRLKYLTAGRFTNDESHQLAVAGDTEIQLYTAQPAKQLVLTRHVTLSEKIIQINAIDIDRDRIDELAVLHSEPNGITIFSLLEGEFVPRFSYSFDDRVVGDVPFGIQFSDFDHDGWVDIAAHTFTGFWGQFYMKNGNFLLSNQLVFERFLAQDITSGDYDRDGKTEFILSGYSIDDNKPGLLVVCGTEEGIYNTHIVNLLPREFPVLQRFVINTCDLNHDTKPDIVLCDYLKNQLVFLVNETEPD